MKLLFALAAIALIAGCASPTVSELRGPDGRALKNVKCNMDSQKCLSLAHESCKESGGTYQVISSHSNAGGIGADAIPGPVTWFNMTYACGPSDGRMPRFEFRGPQGSSSDSPTITNCRASGKSVNCVSY